MPPETGSRDDMTDDAYMTIGAPARAEIKVQGSRFLAFCYPARTREEALDRLKALRKEYHDATHHCFAYRLGARGEDFRTADDGEPSGTAGKPLLSAIDRRGLSDLMVVVVRYFGGTRLGVGGLARAYAAAAEAVLAAAPAETRYDRISIFLGFGHPLTPRVMRAVNAAGAAVSGSWYDSDAHLEISVRRSAAEALRRSLLEATNGAIRFEEGKRGA
ncbi:MAG TPA: YigZ family protein [Bacteroidota bacterium]